MAQQQYRWTLNFAGGKQLAAVGPLGASAWYLYYSNGYLRLLGREFFNSLQCIVLCGQA